MSDTMKEAALQDVLRHNGFVPCDIPACNCGSWHARYGLTERMQEIKDILAEAGYPLSNENGNLVSNALRSALAAAPAPVPASPVSAAAPEAVAPEVEAIRVALAALPEECLKPWVQLDKLPYLHATDDPQAKPYNTPVVGRFDYLPTAEYIKACNPVAVRKLLDALTHPPAASDREGDAIDALRWRWLPAFFEEYQIDAMKLYRDIDGMIADDAQRIGREKGNGNG